MHNDYVDDWDALPPALQAALEPIVEKLDEAADVLFDRRLNLSFEAAVKEIAIPGIVALTQAVREIRDLLSIRVTRDGEALLFDGMPITQYDLPLYMPCVYLSQVAQHLAAENVRVWKPETLIELIQSVAVMADCATPGSETARVVTAALCDLAALDRDTITILHAESEARRDTGARGIIEAAIALIR